LNCNGSYHTPCCARIKCDPARSCSRFGNTESAKPGFMSGRLNVFIGALKWTGTARTAD